MSMCFGMGIVDVNDMVCVELDRLRHYFNVLTQ